MKTKLKWKKGVLGYRCEDHNLVILKGDRLIGRGHIWGLLAKNQCFDFDTLAEAKKKALELIQTQTTER